MPPPFSIPRGTKFPGAGISFLKIWSNDMSAIIEFRHYVDGRLESIDSTSVDKTQWRETTVFGSAEERDQYHWAGGPPGATGHVYVNDCGRHYCDARVVRMAITGWLNYIRDIRKIRPSLVNLREAFTLFNGFFGNQSRVSLFGTDLEWHAKAVVLTAAGFECKKESGQWVCPQV